MRNELCICIYQTFGDDPGSIGTTIAEFIFSVIICVFGVRVNYVFRRKLQKEKKSTPLGQKGNVVEPLMNTFCVIQMVYWPFDILFMWIMSNQIIPAKYMDGWWCYAIYPIGIKFGRICIGYNSLLVALIRYIYIVHQKKANNWEFARVGRLFRAIAIAFPLCMETAGFFTQSDSFLTTQENFPECIASYQGLNNTDHIQIESWDKWTMNFVPEWIVLTIGYVVLFVHLVVLLNVFEGFLYFAIYKSITR